MTLDHTKIGHFPTNPYLQNKLIQNLYQKKKKSLIARAYNEASMGIFIFSYN